MIRISDFFAGVGGVRLGFEQSSPKYRCVFSNDINKFATKTYEANFPGHNVDQTNISDLDPDKIPDFDIFMGGFPCQPFSIAGKQEGFSDTRGNIFFDIVRILVSKRPSIIFLENVKNLVTHDKGRTIDVITSMLAMIGYNLSYKVLSSAKYGNIPQNRERIFIVGFLDRKKADLFCFPDEVKLDKRVRDIILTDVSQKYYNDKSTIYPKLVDAVTKNVLITDTIYQYRRHYVRENKNGLCPTLTANMGGGGHNVPIVNDGVGIRKLTTRECFLFQGFPLDYKLPDDVSQTQLYKQAGNSVTVNVVQRISSNILNAIEGRNCNGVKGTIINSTHKMVGYDPNKKIAIVLPNE